MPCLWCMRTAPTTQSVVLLLLLLLLLLLRFGCYVVYGTMAWVSVEDEENPATAPGESVRAGLPRGMEETTSSSGSNG